MKLYGTINKIRYRPLLCKELPVFDFDDIEEALIKHSNLILNIDKNNSIALSKWVSPKRTRSYPYARVYDTLNFLGKRVTIIPIYKDEGLNGDRDFLQWDTISLMSLLNVYVIIAYYCDADKNCNYINKITNQIFDITYVKEQLNKIILTQSEALHWNLEHVSQISKISKLSIEKYQEISEKLNIKMHSFSSITKKVNEISKGNNEFLALSRKLSEEAQNRELVTTQPKEFVDGTKSLLTIHNFLGGNYYMTCDEIRIENDNIFLIEAKHSSEKSFPAIDDIKDGLIKMFLFTNIEEVNDGAKSYSPIPVLKLSAINGIDENNLSDSQKGIFRILRTEAEVNNFNLLLL